MAFARNDLNATDVWAVGYYVNSSSVDQTLIEKYHSGSWSIVSSPNQGSSNNVLKGVAGNSASNYWAAGYYYNGTVNQTLVEYMDSSGWHLANPMPPNHGSDNSYLTSVSVLGTGDVWVAGYYIDSSNHPVPMTIHWNGSSWSTPYYLDSGRQLDGISMLSSSDGWTVGWQTYEAYAARWNGSAWTGGNTLSSKNHAVDYNSTNSAWSVGAVAHFNAPDTTFAMHWDGTSWSNTNSVDPSGDCSLLGVSAAATTDVWAVGYYKDSTNLYRALVEHYN